MIPSDEQSAIIEHIRSGKNVLVDAVAGAGKSSTVLFVAREFPARRILQLTYNASLRLELKEKIAAAGITNLDVHTFHSLGVRYYLHDCFTDIGLRKVVSKNILPREEFPPYDIVVLDEVQDMTLLYYRFVHKALSEMGATRGQLLVLGDYKQSLYEFKGADARFLTKADVLWTDHPYLVSREFVKCGLRTSYRITAPMARFVNEVMLGENRLDAAREGVPVVYIRYTKFDGVHKIIREIQALITSGASPADFFILSGSLRGNSNLIKSIENELVERGIPCNVPLFETDGMDDRIIQGKLVFSTFHSVKGRQRPYVFVIGFSQTYMDIMQKDSPHDICPNTLYVACTRAQNKLYLFEEDNGHYDAPCKFLKFSHKEMSRAEFVEFFGIPRLAVAAAAAPAAPPQEEPRTHYTTPTDLVRFIAEDVYDVLIPLIDEYFVVERAAAEEPLDIPVVKCMSRGNYEEISDINGIAIPCMFFDHLDKKSGREATFSSMYRVISAEMERIKKTRRRGGKIMGILENILVRFQRKHYTTADYLYLANAYGALKENLYFKLYQITDRDYNWLTPNMVKKCFKVIRETITANSGKIEETIIEYADPVPELDSLLDSRGIHRFRLSARVDLVTDDTVWEIKCTNSLSIEHYIQVALYAWIWRNVCHYDSREFRIFNIKTGEIRRLTAPPEVLETIALALLKNKYSRHVLPTDDEFLQISRENIYGTATTTK